jgi:DNA-binding response OmpR family regulator
MTEPTRTTEQTRTRIVVADDDADILDLVVLKLNQAGFDTVAVTDGVAALAAIEAEHTRLAILDIMMPGMSGIDVLRHLRVSAATKDVDVILLTARAHESDIKTGLAAGASDYITRPFSPRELLTRVNAVLARGEGQVLDPAGEQHLPAAD